MADEKFPDEDELQNRQTTGLYPVGRALRTTFDAENHDSLGDDLTGLMLELARIDPDKPEKVRVPPAVVPVTVPVVEVTPGPLAEMQPVSWWRRWFG